MITSKDARFIISEIRNMPYYVERTSTITKQIEEIRERIAEASSPVSPNGGVDIGEYPDTVRIKILGHGDGTDQRITALVTEEAVLNTERSRYLQRWKDANGWKQRLEHTQDGAFCRDFFVGKSYGRLEREYAVSNAYDRMIRIIRNTIPNMRG